jgi:hypothetical protein
LAGIRVRYPEKFYQEGILYTIKTRYYRKIAIMSASIEANAKLKIIARTRNVPNGKRIVIHVANALISAKPLKKKYALNITKCHMYVIHAAKDQDAL